MENDGGLEKQLNNMMAGKMTTCLGSTQTGVNREMLIPIAKKIQSLRLHYTSISKLAKDFQCYSKGCNSNSTNLTNSCYSPLCTQRNKVRRELLLLLRKANVHTANTGSGISKLPGLLSPQLNKKPSILEQKLTEGQKPKEPPSEASICQDLASAILTAAKFNEEQNTAYVPKKMTGIKGKFETKMEIENFDSGAEKENSSAVKENLIKDNSTVKENMKKDNVIIKKENINLKKENVTVKLENVEDIASKTESENCLDKNDIIKSPPLKKSKKNSSSETDNVDLDVEMSPEDIKAMILGDRDVTPNISVSSTINQIITTTLTTTTQSTAVDGITKTIQTNRNIVDSFSVTSVNNSSKTIQTLNAKATYSAQQNRRFCAFRTTVKREEKVLKMEHAEDGTERIYSATSTGGKVYLKKVTNNLLIDKKKRKQVIKYPVCSTFQTKKGIKSLLVLPKYEVRKLARHAGRIFINGFHALAKPNNTVWPYPCARPLFKTCWVYRTVNLKSLAAAALQLRILWACLRWDDMQMKPPNTDGKHQITTETEILSLELLKHRHVGQFLEKTQYLRRKVVIPLELPKTVRGENFFISVL